MPALTLLLMAWNFGADGIEKTLEEPEPEKLVKEKDSESSDSTQGRKSHFTG